MSSSLIDTFMPTYALRQVDRVAVAAGPGEAYAAARSIDLSRIGVVRLLFELRILPDRIAAWARRKPYTVMLSSRIDDFVGAGSGFMLLAEAPGREVVVGAIGKFWKAAIEYAPATPATFPSFDRPGFGKLAWCIRVAPRAGGGSWIDVELRVGATDTPSLARFRRYWRVVGPFSHSIRRTMLRALAGDLGAVPPDERRALEGDDILGTARLQKTHAVTIEAPASRVWPWLVQMGASRAGWYSYDLLDNGGVHSAEVIVPELQRLSVGDVIPALPGSPDGFAVLRLERERSLVLGDPALLPGGRKQGGPPWQTTWAFVLEPVGDTATRLVVRARADFEPRPSLAVAGSMLAVAHEVMERRQLRNLRRRAEAQA
jgi:hypothetical protein